MYLDARSWPFQEARKLLKHVETKGKRPGDMVTFETGYGPSGAPHIGTFAEVVRTLWVMRAFQTITDHAYPVRLIMFSDDYDALRRVPDGMPEWMGEHLGKPLTSVPSPYEDKLLGSSFGLANNMKLVDFVDGILNVYNGLKVGCSPDRSLVSLVSSTEYYKAGKFNDMLDRVWDNYQAIQDIMLPTLGEDRRATYSAFMPVVPPQWGDIQVLQVPVELTGDHEIRFVPPSHADSLIPVISRIHDGLVKLQWKVDWAMRWAYFDVDYEMSGKDLIDSVKASSQICRVLGGTPPLNMTYELFLDRDGAKISKSKGNGFGIEDWLLYGGLGSLSLFMFQNPRSARKLHVELVPQMEDQYTKLLTRLPQPDDPHWHFTTIPIMPVSGEVTFSLLLNLALVSQSRDAESLRRYLGHVDADHIGLGRKISGVLNYARDQGLFDNPTREPTPEERVAFSDLADRLEALESRDEESIQFQAYEVGKAHGMDLRQWFKGIYECLLGRSDGPRFGALAYCLGVDEMIQRLRGLSQ